MGKKKRVLKKTLIAIGEGQAEKAFLSHLKSLYCCGLIRVTTKSAGGKGPDNVISDAIGTLEKTGCDYVLALLDTDIKWPAKLEKEAEEQGVILIASTPCLEGFLLKILGKKLPTPANNKTCKKAMHPLLSGKETDRNSYSEVFTRAVLDDAVKRNPGLKTIIESFSGSRAD